MEPTNRRILLDPLIDNNPITLQVLGLCSALAVTTSCTLRVISCRPFPRVRVST